MTLVLRIPWATPSLNELANRRSRFAYKAQRTRWLRRINEAFLEAKAARGHSRVSIWEKPPKCRVRVTVERFGRMEHALDGDNFTGGLKPVLDALRKLELIDNDTHQAIDLQGRQPKNPHRAPTMWTRITLERLDASTERC